ncbi:MAG: molybdopterin dinucleotide binding domain-containing protein [Gemmatimonadota bacterium]
MTLASTPPLQVVAFTATRRGDPERGPLVTLRAEDAARRLLNEGDLVWVQGPRRQEMARVALDERLPKGGVAVRDIAGIAVSEIVRLVPPERERPRVPRVPRDPA